MCYDRVKDVQLCKCVLFVIKKTMNIRLDLPITTDQSEHFGKSDSLFSEYQDEIHISFDTIQ